MICLPALEAGPKTLPLRTNRFAALVGRVRIGVVAPQLPAGPIDRIVGPVPRAPLWKFQTQRSLAVTGTITPRTLDGLVKSSD